MNADRAIDIRPAVPADVPVILQLIRELAHYERLSHEVTATPERLQQALFGARPAAEALVARVDGTAAGFALFFHNFSTFLGVRGLYLEDLFVLPAYRGLGLGRTLLAKLAALAVERGCGRFEWAVLDWNKPAREFYEALGAQPKPEWVIHRLTGDELLRMAGQGGNTLAGH